MTQPHQLLCLMCIIFCLGDIGNCDPLRAEGPSARAVLGPGVHDEDLSVAATAEVLREGVVTFAESAMTLMTVIHLKRYRHPRTTRKPKTHKEAMLSRVNATRSS